VTLVDHDVSEVVLRIERGEETGACLRRDRRGRQVAILRVDAERLVGGNVDARILGVVRAVRFAEYLGSIGPEDILKCSHRL